jgi:hypothetical protein
MKTVTLALALAMSAVQTVGWVDCCCVLICKHQNDPCKDCAEKPEAAREACCDESHKSTEPATDTAPCSHVQPSSEVASHADPLPPVVLHVVLELPVVPAIASTPECEKTDGSLSRARGSPPLHLLYSVLLI